MDNKKTEATDPALPLNFNPCAPSAPMAQDLIDSLLPKELEAAIPPLEEMLGIFPSSAVTAPKSEPE